MKNSHTGLPASWPRSGEGINLTDALCPPKLVWQDLPTEIPQLAAFITVAKLIEGLPLYAIGGWPRDLLLGREPQDIDLIYNGDDFTAWLDSLGGSSWIVERVTPWSTARLRHRSGRGVELAAPRKEWYLAGGRLQRVARTTLARDLLRRDFTLNTILIDCATQRFADPFGALDAPVWQPVHSDSLAEDPLRVIRLTRFAQVSSLPVTTECEANARTVASGNNAAEVEAHRIRGELDRAARQGVCGKVLTVLAGWGWPGLYGFATGPDDGSVRSFARWIRRYATSEEAHRLREIAGLKN